MDGALLIHKHAGVSSFGVIEELQKQWMMTHGVKRRDVPKLGHGGTLDPFATGLLAVCVGNGVKLARYFLGSTKIYEGVIRFGETTIPGDPTAEISERSDRIPASIEELRELARKLAAQPYLQTPPMHSAKKKDGKPLYELARQGIEIEREPKLCHLYSFEILSYDAPRAKFRVTCSSGTYIRVLAQDFGRLLGTVAMLDSLHRAGAGIFTDEKACSIDQIAQAVASGKRWDELPCWVPFDRLLDGYPRAQATVEEARALVHGQQKVLFDILARVRNAAPAAGGVEEAYKDCLAIYEGDRLVAVARQAPVSGWGIERVFVN